MKKIDVFIRHEDVIVESVIGKVAIVIDVLRASSVLITALANGAQSIRTTSLISQALEIKRREPEVILIGERNAEIIDGFQFGNSPLDMTAENISGKNIVMCTSNGTKAIAAVQAAKTVWIAAFVNMQSIIRGIIKKFKCAK